MLNLEREPELLEFWECGGGSDGEGSIPDHVATPAMGDGEELQLRSGKVVGSRWAAAQRKRTQAARARREARLALQQADAGPLTSPGPSTSPDPSSMTQSSSSSSSSRQLARREETSLQSLGPQQRHALVLAEKRSQKEEEIAVRARDWSYARKANKQKHDQAHGPLSWAKGGAHNLLPR